ncbi:hypothetical protein I7I50_10848 [Histoplasma capsulatum G186AR]|uniref:Secreted protein n=1 Tax=Ajellomyces capsulatus TaxID=5037 RepID=A0A8H7Z4V2_AJECA|nr:hypothetical protein I7I52_02087 [Histoplasma capsulatum]QSS69535.1 hypothetical protein I7I50_10848 [Histoplasma capsulatum G186AR]
MKYIFSFWQFIVAMIVELALAKENTGENTLKLLNNQNINSNELIDNKNIEVENTPLLSSKRTPTMSNLLLNSRFLRCHDLPCDVNLECLVHSCGPCFFPEDSPGKGYCLDKVDSS